jgi:hypothetical protein
LARFGPFTDHSLLKGTKIAELFLSFAVSILILISKNFSTKKRKGLKENTKKCASIGR